MSPSLHIYMYISNFPNILVNKTINMRPWNKRQHKENCVYRLPGKHLHLCLRLSTGACSCLSDSDGQMDMTLSNDIAWRLRRNDMQAHITKENQTICLMAVFYCRCIDRLWVQLIFFWLNERQVSVQESIHLWHYVFILLLDYFRCLTTISGKHPDLKTYIPTIKLYVSECLGT